MDRFILKTGKCTLLCGLILFLACTATQAQVIDGIAAIVNDKVITFSEVKRQVEPTERQLRSMHHGLELMDRVKEARLATLKTLIERQLIIQHFDTAGYFIPENIVENRLQEVIDKQYGGDRRALIRTLQANGVSVASFKEELREQMIVQAMRGQHVSKAVIVSPYKIEQYYQENIKEFTRPPQVKVRILFLRKGLFPEKRVNEQGKEEEFDPQLEIIQELHHKLETGSDFASITRSYSEGAQRDKGGDWGWVSSDTLRKELSEVAFSLQPGQISKVISTDDGYYILMIEDRRRTSVIPLDEVRGQIEKTLLQEERTRLQQEWLDSLRAKAFIKMF